MLAIVNTSFVRTAVSLHSAPRLMCAVYRRTELKLGFVTARSKAKSVSCLCRNSSNIRIRIAVEITFILSVAKLYVYVIRGAGGRLYTITDSVVCVPYPVACPKPVYDKSLFLSLFAIWFQVSECQSGSFFMFIFIWCT